LKVTFTRDILEDAVEALRAVLGGTKAAAAPEAEAQAA